MATEISKYLDPKTLTKVGNLDLKARLIVEGYISGQHKSPFHGFSVEFAEHREYSPGDDFKHLDWKVWAKSDRYYIKQYEEETNLRSYILMYQRVDEVRLAGQHFETGVRQLYRRES